MAVVPASQAYPSAPAAAQQSPGQTSTASQGDNRAASGANDAPSGTAGC